MLRDTHQKKEDRKGGRKIGQKLDCCVFSLERKNRQSIGARGEKRREEEEETEETNEGEPH